VIRRRLFTAAAAALALPAAAQQRKSLADPMRLGVDTALAESGLARALQVGFGRDTGVAVKLEARPAAAVLEALERGELDASLTNAPEIETKLFDAGYAHDRRLIATGAWWLVGPKPKSRKQPDPAGIAGERDIAAALAKLRDAPPGTATFLSANDGSGTHLAELAIWRAAQIGPAAPWYANAPAGPGSFIAKLRGAGAYGMVEQGAWQAMGGAPLAVLVQGDPRMEAPVHFMRSFRSSHPAAKLFVGWISGPKGRRVVVRARGYRA
jgi:tungstate transport system substrate-binding protein